MWILIAINLVVFIGFGLLSRKKPAWALPLLPVVVFALIIADLFHYRAIRGDDHHFLVMFPIILLPVSIVLIHWSPTSSELERPWYKFITGFILDVFKSILILAAFVLVFQYFAPVFFIIFIAGVIQYVRASRSALVMDVISAIGLSMRQSLPLPMALASAAHGQKRRQRQVFNAIAHWLSVGYPLSDAIKRGYPACPTDILASITAAEKMNQLPNVIDSLQANLSEKLNDRKQINSIQPWYPLTVFTMVFFNVLGLTMFIVPTFAEILLDMSDGKSGLPAATQQLMDASGWLRGNDGLNALMVTTLLFLVCAVAIYVKFRRRQPERPFMLSRWGDRLKWYLPVFHWFEKTFSNLQLVQSLRTGLLAGYPVNQVLSNCLVLDINQCFRRRLKKWLNRIESGHDISQSARKSGLDKTLAWAFDDKVNKGNTPAVLESLEHIYRSQYNYRKNVLNAALWPFIVLALGLCVGWVIYAMFMAICSVLYVTLQGVIPQ
ncbi:MAG: type II secretion system F family protein [Planctomycetota bacterium]|jgi:type IV pilus assembly protein PilC